MALILSLGVTIRRVEHVHIGQYLLAIDLTRAMVTENGAALSIHY